jgi:hypothetical protein
MTDDKKPDPPVAPDEDPPDADTSPEPEDDPITTEETPK